MRERNSAQAATASAPHLLPLLYHELRPEPSSYSYVLPCSRFAQHIDLFARLRTAAPGNYTPLFTFDDGHLSNHAYAMPMLDRAGESAHFFITAGWTGTRTRYMTPQHLRDLHAAGHTVGAHGWSHTLLTACSDADLKRELNDARAALEDWLAAPVTSMSLPGGRFDARVLRACSEAGYSTVWTSTPHTTHTISAAQVGRFNILAGVTDDFLEQLLNPASGVLQRATRTSRLKATAQQLLGDRLYARLWATINRHEPDTPEGSEL